MLYYYKLKAISLLLNNLKAEKLLENYFLKINVSYCFAIKAIKHKISKMITALDVCGPVCTDRTVKLYHLAQKRSLRFTKLLLPYTSQ